MSRTCAPSPARLIDACSSASSYDTEPFAEFTEQLPRRFSLRLRGRQRGAEVPERGPLADRDRVEHRRLHAGTAGHQDGHQFEVGGQGVPELASRLVGVGAEVDAGVEPARATAPTGTASTRTPAGTTLDRTANGQRRGALRPGAAPIAAQTRRSCTYRSVIVRTPPSPDRGSIDRLTGEPTISAVSARRRRRRSAWPMEFGDDCGERRRSRRRAPRAMSSTPSTGEGAGQRPSRAASRRPPFDVTDEQPRRRRRTTEQHETPHRSGEQSSRSPISTICPVTVSYGSMNVGEKQQQRRPRART